MLSAKRVREHRRWNHTTARDRYNRLQVRPNAMVLDLTMQIPTLEFNFAPGDKNLSPSHCFHFQIPRCFLRSHRFTILIHITYESRQQSTKPCRTAMSKQSTANLRKFSATFSYRGTRRIATRSAFSERC